jgi:D,D-heptose 1,7-bisphosphate phosphatase
MSENKHRNRWLRPGVFLDRDGTINEDRGYIGDPSDVVLIDGAAEAIRRLNRLGVPVIVLTNQSGIGRGYYNRTDLVAVNKRLGELLEEKGAHVDGIYWCPHRPDENCE